MEDILQNVFGGSQGIGGGMVGSVVDKIAGAFSPVGMILNPITSLTDAYTRHLGMKLGIQAMDVEFMKTMTGDDLITAPEQQIINRYFQSKDVVMGALY